MKCDNCPPGKTNSEEGSCFCDKISCTHNVYTNLNCLCEDNECCYQSQIIDEKCFRKCLTSGQRNCACGGVICILNGRC